ncbi:hypothetical protein D3C81_961020 [compost metagenome]
MAAKIKIVVLSSCSLIFTGLRGVEFSLLTSVIGSLITALSTTIEMSIMMPANRNGIAELIPYNLEPTPNANTEPSPPIKLIIPFALVRSRSGVMSGISATVGERNKLMDKFINTIKITNMTKPVCKGMSVANTAPKGIPISKYGILRPNLVFVLSLRCPIHGCRKIAK